jgi:uncharacterized protein (TIGR02271 family)
MDTTARSNSLVAIFQSRDAAEDARNDLLENGISADQVEITSADDYARNAAYGNTGLSGHPHDSSGGGISGFFHRLFGHDENRDDTGDRAYYDRALRSGRCAGVVHATDAMIDRAADILNDRGAIDMETEPDTGRDEYTAGASDRRDEGYRAGANEGRSSGDRAAIPVVKEELHVGKRAVQRGGVRVYSNVSERPVEENVSLREEHVRVDRRPVDRPATDADLAAADRGVVEVTETVEEPVVQKSARVVEEVVISKDVRERTEKVRDTVRASDVRVEKANPGANVDNSDLDTDFRNDFRTRYGETGRYDDYAPAYRYGYQMASDPRYSGRSYEDVEQDLRSNYERQYPGSTWERFKDSVRYGWNKVTRKA